MPYIDLKRRDEMANYTCDGEKPDNAGELNYTITRLLIEYMTHKGHSYQTFNDISGAMTECLAEFRRRVIVPYEDGKILENGDIY